MKRRPGLQPCADAARGAAAAALVSPLAVSRARLSRQASEKGDEKAAFLAAACPPPHPGDGESPERAPPAQRLDLQPPQASERRTPAEAEPREKGEVYKRDWSRTKKKGAGSWIVYKDKGMTSSECDPAALEDTAIISQI
ncbi:UNVERIFIED_CONTAM: hypothetical protein K2H54_036634 [Gekko kuhli]